MKKLLLIAAIAGGIYYFTQKEEKTTPVTEPTKGPKELTDQEAILYAEKYADLKEAYGNDLEKLKFHWFNFGFFEGRTI